MKESNITVIFNIGNEPTYILLSLLVINISGVVSNLLLLVAFIKDPLKCFRNSGTYLVMNLAVSDCLISLYYSFMHVELNLSTRLFFPPIFYLFLNWFKSVSFVSITSISIDRFLIVAYPMKYRILMKGKVMILWIAAVWIMCCVIPLFLVLSDIRETKSSEILKIICNVIVIALSAVMYSSTYRKLKKQSRNIALQNSTESRAQEIRILKEKRFLKTIIIIACIAFVCIVPPMLTYLMHVSLGLPVDNLAFIMAIRVFYILYFINFAVNPLIYILRLPNYRKTFYLIYCKRRTASRWDGSGHQTITQKPYIFLKKYIKSCIPNQLIHI